ncbi:DMT family transporter [Gemella sp. GH3]|uniref:DMT family transporter n=1 Tax=unclassified Gemella TaxID=2624949 RepID=UPI0015D059D5|nr:MULTISPECIES: DMT family transporter [unclassified Gemella]MBF0714282.1 DMT family transporter [Gemella sp. GH3.1]NYS51234.1 DMT family transporter [Gemella sp. GH3]
MDKQNNIFLGVICILLSGIGFSFMAVFVKLSGDLPVMQKSFFRNFISLIVSAIPIINNYKNVVFPKNKKDFFVLLLRSFFGTIGLLFNFYAISNINLADASVIQRLSPFVVLILSYFLFNEKMTFKEILAILCAFLGILLVIKPGLGNFISLGALFALLGAFCAGAAYTSIRYLGGRKISPEFIIFSFSLFSCIVVLPFVVFDFRPMTTYQFIMLLLVGIFATIGQFGITYAYRFAAAKSISVFDYSQIIFAGLLGYIFFLEVPDFYAIIGYIVIICMGLLISVKK